jgi:hypothetical protein
MQDIKRWLLKSVEVLGVLFVGALMLAAFLSVQAATSPVEPQAQGDTETVEARVVRVLETTRREIAPGQTQPVQRLELEIVSGPLRGQIAQVEHGARKIISEDMLYQAGDRVLVMAAARPDGSHFLMITDVVRW